MTTRHAPEEPATGRPLLVLRKVAAILDAFAAHGWDLSAHRVGELAGLPPSTARRLLANLVDEGFLERAGNGYQPGTRLVGWQTSGRQAALATSAQPVLDRLRDETGETALLFVRDGLSRVIAALAPTRHVVLEAVSLGEVWPLHAGSGGQILLAFDEEATERLLMEADHLARCAPGTITDPERLRVELGAVRSRGYAVSTEERAPGTTGVSAPVFGPDGCVRAALGIGGPAQRLDTRTLRRYRPAVQRAAHEMSRMLAHAPRPTVKKAGALR